MGMNDSFRLMEPQTAAAILFVLAVWAVVLL